MSDYVRKRCTGCHKRKTIQKSYDECLHCRTYERVNPKKAALYLHGMNIKGFLAWRSA